MLPSAPGVAARATQQKGRRNTVRAADKGDMT